MKLKNKTMKNTLTQKLSLQRKVVVRLSNQPESHHQKNARNNDVMEQHIANGQHKFTADRDDTTIFDSFFCR